MKKNSMGAKVTDLQQRLKLLDYDLGTSDIDGIYGGCTEDAVKKFQQNRGLRVSGIIDWETWQELVDAGYKIGDRLLYLKNPPFSGDDVKILQLWLKTLGFYPYNENGIFCQKTHKALLEFQENMNIQDDGIIGKQTLKHLEGLQRIITEKKTSNFPYVKPGNGTEKQTTYTVIFDYEVPEGKKKDQRSVDAENALICRNIIKSCRKDLRGSGFSVILSFKEDSDRSMSVFDRISNANASRGEYLVSINLSYSEDSSAHGCSCYYFKGLKSFSNEGFRLANIIQDRLVKGLGLQDCRTHGANYAILKNTEMISVLVEPAFISNKKQKKEFLDKKYQEKIGKEISEAIKAFLVDQ